MSAQKKQFYYLVHLQYLGYRYHGWFEQPGLKTVQAMVHKTLKFVLKHERFKTMGASRTDSRASANHTAFQLFLDAPIDADSFIRLFNENLPSDIRALEIETVEATFNIIQSPKTKEYLYLFTFGEKPHPFSATIIAAFNEELDLEKMQQGAQLFEGKHNFKKYCTKPSANTVFEREVELSQIEENTTYTANFFPEKSYAFRIKSKGFMRYQIRLMMGQLLELGKGSISLEELQSTLTHPNDEPLRHIAPASGLILEKTTFDT